jgi:hypothetical protein
MVGPISQTYIPSLKYKYLSKYFSIIDPFCLASAIHSFHSVEFHPVEPRLILSANAKEGAALYDIRMSKRYE